MHISLDIKEEKVLGKRDRQETQKFFFISRVSLKDTHFIKKTLEMVLHDCGSQRQKCSKCEATLNQNSISNQDTISNIASRFYI